MDQVKKIKEGEHHVGTAGTEQTHEVALHGKDSEDHEGSSSDAWQAHASSSWSRFGEEPDGLPQAGLAESSEGLIKVGAIKIEPTAEWARFLRELSRQAKDEGVRLSGRITIEVDDQTIAIEL